MLFLEVFFRSAVAVISLLCVILIFRDAWKAVSAKWVAIFLVALACGAIIHTAEGITPPLAVRAVLLPVSSSIIVLLWIATRSYFDDEFKIGILDGLVMGTWLLLGAFSYSDVASNTPLPITWTHLAREALSYGLVVHIAYVVLSGRAPDLVEPRRRSRIMFALSVVSIYLMNKLGEAVFGFSALPIWFTALLYALFTFLLLAALLALISLEPRKPGVVDMHEAKPITISPDQQLYVARLAQIIEADRAYLEPDLSVRDVAMRIDLAEHKLRALINQAMGFRNFRNYLNGYRVKHAISLLTASDQAALSIIDVAMNSGFGSLASFNRIFKSETSLSPSEVRRTSRTSEKATAATNISPHF